MHKAPAFRNKFKKSLSLLILSNLVALQMGEHLNIV